MLIAEAARLAAASIRRIKEEAVRRAKGRVEIDWVIEAYRGNDPVGLVTWRAPGVASLMPLVDVAATGLAADLVALSAESWYAENDHEAADPRTGMPWGRGAMSAYVEEFGLDGVVNEGLVTNVINRAGDQEVVHQPYIVRGQEVEWLPVRFDDVLLGGYVPNELARIMDKPSALMDAELALARARGVDAERARHLMDVATTRALEDSAPGLEVVLYARRGSPREQTLRETLARRQVVDPSRSN